MIIWLSGPYGVGKSTLARTIQGKLDNCILFDAEKVGDAIRDNYPEEFFQEIYEDYPLWCETCRKLLADLESKMNGTILVPMTLLRPQSLRTILAPLKGQGIIAIHVILTAEPETLRHRILARGEEENCWCMKKIPQCLSVQKDIPCDLRLDTTGKSLDRLAEEIFTAMKAETMH